MRQTAVDIIITKKNSILLLKRNIYPYKGFWVLPGGHVEDNETVEEACIREAEEETGFKIGIKNLIGVFSDPKRDPRKTVSIAFLCYVKSGKLKINFESEEARFFDFKMTPNNIGFDHKLIIERAKKYLYG